MAKIEVVNYRGYDDGKLVHQVLMVQQPMGDGHCYHYPIACGLDVPLQHLYYVKNAVTCLACLASPPLWIPCTRKACKAKGPVEQMMIHTVNGAPYCRACARRINEGQDQPIVVAQTQT